MPLHPAVFGIASDGLNLAVSLLLLSLVVFWLALVYWTFADAKRRIADPMLVGCATAASLFPFLGAVFYMIVRPPEYLDDVRERELEMAAAEMRLAAIGNLSCPYCNFEVGRSFLRCPSCVRRLKEPCTTCGKPLSPSWKICPYCESELGQPPPQQRRRARPAAATPATGRQRQAAPPPTASAPREATAGQREASAPREATVGQREATAGQREATAAQREATAGQRPAPQARRQAADPRQAPSRDQRRPTKATKGGSRPADTQRPADSASRQRARPAAEEGEDGRPPPGGGRSEKASRTERGSDNGKQRSGRPGPKSGSDAVTAEQRAARPRTRPPSAD
ncbi:MAG: double zinc ribbon domain-containing protein [Thermoleophilaceae bacterium]